jgi:synapsin
MLEQIQMTDRYKSWIDAVSEMYNTLDICALEVVVGKDGREYIIEVNDSALSLMGDTQEEDRRHIADLVTLRMQVSDLKIHSVPLFFPLSATLREYLLAKAK